MNEDMRNNMPSGLENQNNELNDEQLDEVTGGAFVRMELNSLAVRCSGNPSHTYVPRTPGAACPICGAKAVYNFGRS